MKVKNIIEEIKNKDEGSLDTFRQIINNDGHRFEKMFDIIVRISETFKGFTPVYGNFGSKKQISTKELTFQEILNEQINNGSAQGDIDMILKNKNKKEIILLTFKYFEKEKPKSIKEYDVKELFETGRIVENFYRGYTVTYGIVTNCYKDELAAKISKSRHSSNTKLVENYTLTEIEKLWFNCYKLFKENSLNDIIEKIDNKKLSCIYLRYYQEYALKKIQKIFQKNNMCLLGALPRFGKTYVIGELLLNYDKILFTSNIVTNLKEGLISFFTEHALSSYNDYKIYLYNECLLNEDIINKKIVVTSNQKLRDTKTSEKFNLIVIDEAHIGGTSENIQDIIKEFSNENTKVLYCTATFKKPYREFDMAEKSFVFSLDDVASINNGNSEIIEDIEKTLNRKILQNEITIKYPKINYINLSLNPSIKTEISEVMKVNKGFNSEEYISMWKNNFVVKDKKFLPEGKTCITNVLDAVFKLKDKRIDTGLIKKISNNILGFKPKIILCFCPGGSENMTTKNVLDNMKILFDNRYCDKTYKSLVFYSNSCKNVKSVIESNVDSDRILIVFVCRMLETAITLKDCSGVIFLDDNHSEDVIIQRIYRPATFVEGKDNVFILDINPLRTIELFIRIGIRSGKIKSIDDIKRSIKSIDSLVHFDSRDFGFNDNDTFYSSIIDKYFEKAEFINILQEIDFDYSNLRFMGTIKKQSASRNQRFEEVENKSMTLESSSNIKSVKDSIDTSEIENLEMKKKVFKEMINKIFYTLCVISIKDNIKDALLEEQCRTAVENISDKQYNSSMNFENFKDIICAYNQELLNQSFLKIQITFMSGNMKQKFEIINKLLKPNELQKKTNGEVFTPLSLVNDMLDKLPEEVWSNPNLKWLDPAAGVGNFLIAVYERLMRSLTSISLDNRSEHIVKNMLYAVDICSINTRIYKKLLGDDVNVSCISYFDFNIKNFDIIIGNPPYNDCSGNKGKGHALWVKFIEKSLEILKDDGYLCFINPSSWRQIEDRMFKMMTKYQLLYLEIHNEKDGQKVFKCSTRYDWYILHKKLVYTNTEIKDEEGKLQYIDVKKWKFLPNKMYEEISKITENYTEKLDVNRHRSDYGTEKSYVSKNYSDEFKYPVIYSINRPKNKKNQDIVDPLGSDVAKIYYSSRNDKGHFGLSKFIFSNGAGALCDPEGKYGITEWSYCIYDQPENLEYIQKAFLSPKFNNIKNAIKFGSSSYNIKVMKLFKKDFYKDFL